VNQIVASSYAEPLLAFYRQYKDPSHEDVELDALMSKKRRYFSLEEYQELLRHTCAGLKRQDYVFDLLPTTEISNHGTLVLAVLCGLNLKQVLSIVSKFYRTRSQLFDLVIKESDETVEIQLVLNYALGDLEHHTLEIALGTIYKSKKDILDIHTSIDEIHFTCERPEYYERYDQFFDGPVYFNQPNNKIVFAKEQLKMKLRFASPDVQKTLLAQCEQDLNNLGDKKDLLYIIKQALQNQQDNMPSLDEMAKKNHVSSRTLRRHFQQKNTTYQTLVIEERCRRAKVLLQESDLSVTEIAQQLGYNDSANFSKTFKRFNQKSPQQYRQSLLV
jgi:AraC-like DNA-binding protein